MITPQMMIMFPTYTDQLGKTGTQNHVATRSIWTKPYFRHILEWLNIAQNALENMLQRQQVWSANRHQRFWWERTNANSNKNQKNLENSDMSLSFLENLTIDKWIVLPHRTTFFKPMKESEIWEDAPENQRWDNAIWICYWAQVKGRWRKSSGNCWRSRNNLRKATQMQDQEESVPYPKMSYHYHGLHLLQIKRGKT